MNIYKAICVLAGLVWAYYGFWRVYTWVDFNFLTHTPFTITSLDIIALSLVGFNFAAGEFARLSGDQQ